MVIITRESREGTVVIPETHLALDRALEHARKYVRGQKNAPVRPSATREEFRARLDRGLVDEGVDPATVIDDLVADLEGGIMNSSGGRFFGWVVGGTLPAAMAADWLASTWDQNSAFHALAPGSVAAEEIVGDWLKQILGLPSGASFALVTGCQMAHVTCLAAARHSLLRRLDWDVERQGLAGSPPIRVLTSDRYHVSSQLALRMLGIGTDSIVALPSNESDELEPGMLLEALEQDREVPTVVLLQAGDVNIGSFDPFPELISLAHQYGAWVHVDGAFGLWAGASEKRKHLVKGVEEADSWACDGHKWLNVPYDCGYAFVMDREAHRASMSMKASYLSPAQGGRDPIDWTPEMSRRGRALASYAAIRSLGKQGIAELVENTSGHAHSLVTRIGALDGAEVLRTPIINQGLVRFVDPDGDHDAFTDRVIEAICETGEAFFGGTNWNGMRAMRVSVCSWMTDENDLERTLAAVEHVLDAMTKIPATGR